MCQGICKSLTFAPASLNLPYQTHYQCNPRRQVVQFYIFSGVVREAAACSQAIDGGDAHSGGGVGVGCATTAHVLNLQTQWAARFPDKLDNTLVCLVAFKGLAQHTATKGDGCSLQLVLSRYLAHCGL